MQRKQLKICLFKTQQPIPEVETTNYTNITNNFNVQDVIVIFYVFKIDMIL